MNSISPYTIRCFDPLAKGKKVEDSYSPLDKVGAFDTYKVVKDFIKAKSGAYHHVPNSTQVYAFHNFVFDDAKRVARGYLRAGGYGTKTDIINIKSWKVDFTKQSDNAEVIDHYVQLFIPKQLNEGVALLHTYKNIGIKTLLHDLLRVEFLRVTKRVLQMNPLAYEQAYNEWQKAKTRELKLVRFKGLGAAEQQIAKLGHSETEVKVKAGRNKAIGVLANYFKPGTAEHSTLELLSPFCEQVKAVVELGGKKRTFRLGANPSQQVCEIEVDEKQVTVVAGNPNSKELDAWCRKLMNDFLKSMYPGMGIKV